MKKTAKKAAKKTAKKVARAAAATTGRKIKNGVTYPIPGTKSARLWEICDTLKGKLGRAPARFEFRGELERLAGLRSAETFNPDSASFQFFQWRKFHGIAGRASGLFPKKNTFEVSTNAADRQPTGKPRGPKPKSEGKAKPAAKKAAKKAATKKPDAPAKPGKVKGGKGAGATGAATAKKAAKKTGKAVSKKRPSTSAPKTAKSTPSLPGGKKTPAKKAAAKKPAVSAGSSTRRNTGAKPAGNGRKSSVPDGGLVVIPDAPAGEA